MKHENNIEEMQSEKLAFELRCAAAREGKLPDAKKVFAEFKAKNGKIRKMSRWTVTAYGAAAAACVVVLFVLHGLWGSMLHDRGKVYEALALETDEVQVIVDGKPVTSETLATDGMSAEVLNWQNGLNEHAYNTQDAHSQQEKSVEVVVPACKTVNLTLPDGTKVCLAANSHITFPSSFESCKVREVMLAGEAYFSVTHNEECPFVVKCDRFSTKVFGTEFNVRNVAGAYPEVTLVNGRVAVSSGEVEVMLKPMQMATLTDNNELTVGRTDVEVVTSWKNGGFYFDGQTIREVLVEVGRWYNMDVVFRSKEHIDDKIHFNAERSWSAKETVDCLNQISSATIEIETNAIVVK